MYKFLLILSFSLIFISCSDKSSNGPSGNDKNPGISSINPASGYAGSLVTIAGTNFSTVQGNSSINFEASKVSSSDIISWSDKQIVFRVNNQTTDGKYNISVEVSGIKSNSVELTIKARPADAPQIQGLSKSTATVGETIKITGQNFGATQNTAFVELRGRKAISYLRWQDNEVICLIPEDAETGDIYVHVNNVPSNAKPLTIQTKFKLLKMVTISGGTFQMGGSQSGEWDNKPIHSVTITKNFDISITEITQKEWATVMDGSNPSQVPDTGDFKPVQQVSFKRVVEFCNRLSDMEQLPHAYQINGDDVIWNKDSKGYRLPTEAEWEYACRAGNNNDYSSAEIQSLGWCADNSGGRVHDVKLKQPNAWGIYDMLGNVAEWCWDEYTDDYYSKSPGTDPPGPETTVHDRITRGGSVSNGVPKINSNIRASFPGLNDNYNYDLGFRVVRNK